MSKFMKVLSLLLCIVMISGYFTGCTSFQKKPTKDTQAVVGTDTQAPEETGTPANTETDTQPDTPPDMPPETPSSGMNTLVGQFTDREIKNESAAISAVQDVAKELGLENAAKELTAKSTNTVDGLTYYKLQQNYQGIPVYGSTFVVVSDDNGTAKGLTGRLLRILSLLTASEFRASQQR